MDNNDTPNSLIDENPHTCFSMRITLSSGIHGALKPLKGQGSLTGPCLCQSGTAPVIGVM